MTLNEFQQAAAATSEPACETVQYLALALCGESGEVAEKVKKVIRDRGGKFFADDCKAIALEIGDVLWYASVLAKVLGYSLEQVCEMNIQKIKARVENGTLHGSGDNR